MRALEFKSNEFGPEVIQEGHKVRIVGKSMIEDAPSYFNPLHDWVRELLKTEKRIEIDFDLTYFNSPSAKQILKLLMIIDESDAEATVRWYYPKDNDLLLERGQELAIMVDLKIEYIPK